MFNLYTKRIKYLKIYSFWVFFIILSFSYVHSSDSTYLQIFSDPQANSRISAGKNIKLKIRYNIPDYSRENKCILAVIVSGNRYRKQYENIILKDSTGSVNTLIELNNSEYLRIDSDKINVTVVLLKESGHKFFPYSQITKTYYKTGIDKKNKNNSKAVDIKNGSVSIKNLSRKNNENLLPGENIVGELDYSFPGMEKERISVYFSYIIDGIKTRQTIYSIKGGSGSLKFYYTFPFAKARKMIFSDKGKEVVLLFEFKKNFKKTTAPFFVFGDIRYRLIPRLMQKGGWKEVTKEKGFPRFMRQLSPVVIDGELHLYYYTHKNGIFLKQRKDNKWIDISLPAQVKKANSNRPLFRYINNVLYFSFLQYDKKKEHRWYLFKRENDQWIQLGEPIVLKNFRWGILSDSFNISPQGIPYRIYSEDYKSYLQIFYKDKWITRKVLPWSAGYYSLEFNKKGLLYIAIGQQNGYPGVKVKKYFQGRIYDVSQGLPFKPKGYIEKYKFVKYKDDLYYAFRGNHPRRGFTLYKYSGRRWYTIGKMPIAYTAKGDSGGDYGFSFYRNSPVIAYSEYGMNFVPMVMSYYENNWKPVGTPGFFWESAGSVRVIEFKEILYCFFTARDRKDKQFYFYTYQYEK